MRVGVTGITGSFGRAFIRHAVRGDVSIERLVGLSRDELKQSEVATEFDSFAPLRLFLGDVRDADRLVDAFHGLDTVIHAAALKRVDATAYNPHELVATNILGTQNVIRAATQVGVRRVLLISSDKCVQATNIYGSSKAVAEHLAVASNAHSYPRGTAVSVLRYGNVLGSRGSVVHIWRSQVAKGDPITVTDRRMTRFVLTLPQAVAYAVSAIQTMQGGEIFVPLLPSARMEDLALAIGGEGYPIHEIGLRPGGEKLAEALLSDEEPGRTRRGDRWLRVVPSVHPWRANAWPGELVAPDLRYVSDGAVAGWASREDLRRLVQEVA